MGKQVGTGQSPQKKEQKRSKDVVLQKQGKRHGKGKKS